MKPKTTGISINNRSRHHPSQKIWVFRTLIRRFTAHCSKEQYLKKEIRNIEKIAEDNGFTKNIVHDMFKSMHRKLKKKKKSL